MTAIPDVALSPAQAMLGNLQRLIEAIDLRAPRPERPDEVRIARDAAELRARAVALIQCIEAATLRSPNGHETPWARDALGPRRHRVVRV